MNQSPTPDDLGRARRKKKPELDPTKLDRLPPHSEEAEEGVLGAILLSPADNLEECVEKFKAGEETFYDPRRQAIYGAMLEFYRDRKPFDLLLLQQKLKDKNLLDAVGGFGYLAGLTEKAGTAGHIGPYAQIVWEKYLLRKLVRTCSDVLARAYEHEGEVDQLFDEVETNIVRVSEERDTSREQNFQEVIQDVVENVIEKFRRGVKFKLGPQTGFNYLDNILPGFGRGQLIVMAARPRTGKSAWLMQTAEHIALNEREWISDPSGELDDEGNPKMMPIRVPVAVFSLEMTSRSLGARAMFQRAGCDITKFYNGFMSDQDIQKLTNAAGKLCSMNTTLFIDESPRMTIEDLEVRMRRMKRRYGIKVFFVDYFQLLYMRKTRQGFSRTEELAEISMRLKSLAKELDVPIVLLAQMNRQIEQDANRRPRLSDLRDTGQLEQDADVVMFLWKPDIKNDSWQERIQKILFNLPGEIPMEWRHLEKPAGGVKWDKNLAIVTCTVEKQREGRSGEDAALVFVKPWTRFVDAYRAPKSDEQVLTQ